jgi:hypothetical protein
MEIALLAVIGLLLLAGLVAFGVGNKGWNLGTVAASILLLLAATGYTFLAGMLAQRERGWREIIGGYQLALAREREGLTTSSDGRLVPDPQRKPLSELAHEKARWEQVQSRIETWRARDWKSAKFQAPTEAKPGSITFADLQGLTLHPGGEVYVFDKAGVEQEGRFLGVFKIEEVNGSTISVTAAVPPSDEDLKIWARPREEVTVYERLPVDRWMAFHSTRPGTAEGSPTLPVRVKTVPEELLKSLEHRLEEVRQHAEPIAEAEWPKLAEDLRAGRLLPGRHWARVEFQKSHSFPRTKKQNEAQQDPVVFEPGQSGTFDFETAFGLQSEGIATITSVEVRRSLADAQTAIRGGEYEFRGPEGEGQRPKIHIEGIAFIRRMLEDDIKAIGEMAARLEAAKKSADSQHDVHRKEADELKADLVDWQADVAAAAQTTERFDRRLADVTQELNQVETAIVELGRELDGVSTVLSKRIDEVAPAGGIPR